MIIAFYQSFLFCGSLSIHPGKILGYDSFKSFRTSMFIRITRLCYSISLVITFFPNILTKFFVIHFMAIGTFYSRTDSFRQFDLHLTLFLDSFMSDFHRFEQFCFRNFIHFSLYHHDIFHSRSYHNIDIGFFQLFECRINFKLSVDTSNTNFRDRTVKRNIRNGKSC